MARKKNTAAADIDWYLISIDRLKQIGLVVVLLLLAGAGWWFYTRAQGNPATNAESAISDARAALNQLAASKEYASHRSEYDRAKRKLEEATGFMAQTKFPEAQGAAVESQTISRAALTGGEGESDAQFLTVEGDVQFQKGSNSDWKKADSRTPLFNGDWVKTGGSASAELMFENGSLYTIGSNALLEIHTSINPTSNKKNNTVQMRVGSIEVATTSGAISTVQTPGSQVVVEEDSTTQVGIDQQKQTSVVSTRGSTSVAPATGGEAIKLGQGQKVSATAAGLLSTVKQLLMPPALQTPADNQVFQLTPESQVRFGWAAQPGATRYLLQVSRSRLFTTVEVNSPRQKTEATARLKDEGAFYWRVASIGPDGEPGPFSTFRRFRVAGGGGRGSGPNTVVQPGDTSPPVLDLKNPFKVSDQFYIIEGTTESGATVFINDEEVEVESNGHFKKLVSFAQVGRNAVIVKAVDPAGNPTVKSQTVIIEE